jgi:hypothetical protein
LGWLPQVVLLEIPSVCHSSTSRFVHDQEWVSRIRNVADLRMTFLRSQLTRKKERCVCPVYDSCPARASSVPPSYPEPSYKKATDKGAPRIGEKVSKAQTRKNRREAQAGRPRHKKIARNAEWEEFPYASTAQGGRGASLTLTMGSQNSSHGSLLRWFYWRNNIGIGNRFFIRVRW